MKLPYCCCLWPCFILLNIVYGTPRLSINQENKNKTLDKRIINGIEARQGQFPFMVSILFEDEHFCGGSLIHAEWVLTAAHCVYGRKSEHLTIFGGWAILSGRRSNGVISNISKIVIHPGYLHKDNFANDIALLKLSKPVTTSRQFQPVKLPPTTFPISSGSTTQVIGWGFTKNYEYEASDKLLFAQILIVSPEQCQEFYNDTQLISSQICAGLVDGGIGQCSGDSGGPLILDDYQIGIVSWSEKPCASKNHPGVFTRVSDFVSWITEVGKEEHKIDKEEMPIYIFS